MNLGQAFSFPFQDPDWIKKIGLMALISLIPIFGQIVALGWCLDITRRVMQRNPVLLPDIDLGNQFTLGLKAFVTGFVWALPILLLQIPTIVTMPMIESGNNDAGNAAYVIISVCCSGLVFLYSIAMGLLLPAAYGNVAAKDTISAAVDFKTIFGLVRSSPGAYLMVLLGSIAASLVAGLGFIACFIGVFLTYIYSLAVMGNLYGQAYQQAASNSALSGSQVL